MNLSSHSSAPCSPNPSRMRLSSPPWPQFSTGAQLNTIKATAHCHSVRQSVQKCNWKGSTNKFDPHFKQTLVFCPPTPSAPTPSTLASARPPGKNWKFYIKFDSVTPSSSYSSDTRCIHLPHTLIFTTLFSFPFIWSHPCWLWACNFHHGGVFSIRHVSHCSGMLR